MSRLSASFVSLATAAVCVHGLNLRASPSTNVSLLEERWVKMLDGKDDNILIQQSKDAVKKKVLSDYGHELCRCIGIEVGGMSVFHIPNYTFEFPTDVGSRCEAWDATHNPLCLVDSPPAWCAQQWCYVDPCACDLPESPFMTQSHLTWQGKPAHGSYATCEATDEWSATIAGECSSKLDSHQCSSTAGCGWTGKHCMKQEVVQLCHEDSMPEYEYGKKDCRCIGHAAITGNATVLVDGTSTNFLATVGGTCFVWDQDVHPACLVEESKKPQWCFEKWCYVDPCTCTLGGGLTAKKSDLDIKYRGKRVYYSYETCGEVDVKTPEVDVPPQYPPSYCAAAEKSFGHDHCRCLGMEVDGYSKYTFTNKVTGFNHTVKYPTKTGSFCKAWDEDHHPDCTTGGAVPEWCHIDWCYVDPCTCAINNPPIKTEAHDLTFRGNPRYLSYATCGQEDKFSSTVVNSCATAMDSWACSQIPDCSWTGRHCIKREVAATCRMGSAPVAMYGDNNCRCIGQTNVAGNASLSFKGQEVLYPAEVGGMCDTWDVGVHPECTDPNASAPFCFQKWCFVDPCECVLPKHPPVKTRMSGKLQGDYVFYSYETCGAEDLYTTWQLPKFPPEFCLAKWVPPPPEPLLSTLSSETAAAGSKLIKVQSQDGFEMGDPIEIVSGDVVEGNTVVGFGSLKLAQPLQYNHPPGAAITRLLVSPIHRVLNVLTEMHKEVLEEKDVDHQNHLKIRCWCYDNKKMTRMNMEDAQANIARLDREIVAAKAKSALLKEEIDALLIEYDKDKTSLNQMVRIREQDQAVYDERDVELTEIIDQLAAAIHILSEHATLQEKPKILSALQDKPNMLSFIQQKAKRDVFDSGGFGMRSSASIALGAMMETEADPSDDATPAPKKSFLSAGSDVSKTQASSSDTRASAPTSDPFPAYMHSTKPPKQAADAWSNSDVGKIRSTIHAVAAFLSAQGKEPPAELSSFLQGSWAPGYESQGDQIIGILKQMHDEFSEDQEKANATETAAVERYNDLFNTKDTQLKNDQIRIDDKGDLKAATDVEAVDMIEEMKEYGEIYKQNKKFQDDVTAKCAEEEAQYQTRQSSRTAEADAMDQAILVLSDDEMRAAFTHAYGTEKPASAAGAAAASFLQLGRSESNSRSKARGKALALLREKAERSGSAELSIIASKMKLDPFVDVQKEIADMIEKMKNRQAAEVEENDDCIREIQEVTVDIKTQERELVLSSRKIKKQEDKIADREAKLAKALQDIADINERLRKAKEQRDAEALAFKELKASQWTTVTVLNKAMNKLAAYYNIGTLVTDKEIATGYEIALVQENASQPGAVPATAMNAPPEAKSYKAKSGESVMSLIEKLIFDLKKEMRTNYKAEKKAIREYKDMKEAMEELLFKLNNAVINYRENIAAMTTALLAMRDAHANMEDQLTSTKQYSDTKHAQCDFVMRNFMISQEARQKEIEADRKSVV